MKNNKKSITIKFAKQLKQIIRQETKKDKSWVSNILWNFQQHYQNVSGFTFDELYKSSKKFKFGKEKIIVGNLNDLIKMKEIADRPKDRIFLEKYQSFLKRKVQKEKLKYY